MESLIKEFCENVCKSLVLVIYARPKSKDDPVMKRVIELNSKFAQVNSEFSSSKLSSNTSAGASEKSLSEESIKFVRKSLKKFNLTFKEDSHKPIISLDLLSNCLEYQLNTFWLKDHISNTSGGTFNYLIIFLRRC